MLRCPRPIVSIRLVFVCVLGAASMACAPKSRMIAMRSGQGEAMPVIRIEPGYADRIALMDRYRIHDETRQHLMAKPRVWVEEVSEGEIPDAPTDSTDAPDGPRP